MICEVNVHPYRGGRFTGCEGVLPLEGVVGISHADGKIIFYVEGEKDKSKIPSSYKGFPVEIRVIGRIRS
ncbi:MAG: hypothetical protein L2C94_000735 [Aigarchaeota archaeon]|nr:hypothetical protein [Candidatus Wolframiiraptor gerlachensis]